MPDIQWSFSHIPNQRHKVSVQKMQSRIFSLYILRPAFIYSLEYVLPFGGLPFALPPSALEKGTCLLSRLLVDFVKWIFVESLRSLKQHR